MTSDDTTWHDLRAIQRDAVLAIARLTRDEDVHRVSVAQVVDELDREHIDRDYSTIATALRELAETAYIRSPSTAGREQDYQLTDRGAAMLRNRVFVTAEALGLLATLRPIGQERDGEAETVAADGGEDEERGETA